MADKVSTKSKKQNKSKIRTNIVTAQAHIFATFNNTIVSITDLHGNVLAWCSAGKLGYKGSKKSTSYVAQLVANEAVKKAINYGIKKLEVFLKGPGMGRESAVRGIADSEIEIILIKDITPVPHNGCRPPKKRRI